MLYCAVEEAFDNPVERKIKNSDRDNNKNSRDNKEKLLKEVADNQMKK